MPLNVFDRPRFIVVKVGSFVDAKGNPRYTFPSGPSYQIFVDRGQYYEAATSFENYPVHLEPALVKCAEVNKAIAEGTL
jgi:hypothetical protein